MSVRVVASIKSSLQCCNLLLEGMLDVDVVGLSNHFLPITCEVLIKLNSRLEHFALFSQFCCLGFGLGFGDECALIVHVSLDAHKAQKHADDCELAVDTGMYNLALKLKVSLITLSLEDVEHCRNPSRGKHLEWIGLPIIQRSVVKAKAIARNNPDARSLDLASVEVHHSLGLVGALDGVLEFLALFCLLLLVPSDRPLVGHLLHLVLQLLLGGQAKDEKRRHNSEGSSALEVCGL